MLSPPKHWKGASFIGEAYCTAGSFNKIYKGNGEPIDYIDVTVGTAGLATTGATWAGYSVPYVGQIAAIYGAIRFSYDMGAAYGPSTWYGDDDYSWFK